MKLASTKRGAGGLRIIVLGYIVRGPLGGLAWHHLQYVMGLFRLGHDVYFIEDSDDYDSCYNPQTGLTGPDPDYGLQFAGQCFELAGIRERWAYHDAHTARWHGPCAGTAVQLCKTADLLLNLSGVNPLRPWLEQILVRALVDTDPAFTQLRHLNGPEAMALAQKHNVFFTFGENIGRNGCTIPDDGLPWQATRQPVVIDAWPVTEAPRDGRFTTVMQWDSYSDREYRGVRYGMKSASFDPYLELPLKTASQLELAIGSDTAPRELLGANGWILSNPLEVTRDLETYQRYLQGSKAEFSIAKHGYVFTHSGWFSERSANYLSSGRPVLVQETGFSDWMESGNGVLAFTTTEQALAGIERINTDYVRQCEAARSLAESYFESSVILGSLLERAFQPPEG